jgi:hypothetical protein
MKLIHRDERDEGDIINGIPLTLSLSLLSPSSL